MLTNAAAYSAEDSLFGDLGKHEIFTPIRSHPPMTISDLASRVEEEAARDCA
jgi:hypothetical protein